MDLDNGHRLVHELKFIKVQLEIISSRKGWQVTRSLENDYKLKRGDILRIGRVLMKIKDYRCELSDSFEDQESNPNEDSIIDLKYKDDSPSTSEETCRICFGVESTTDNPLISICNCTGSMKYIHFLCLKTWLHSAMDEKVTPLLISYYWKSFRCEICTTSYPCIIIIHFSFYNS